MVRVLLMAAALMPASAQASDFTCRNTKAEIRCGDGRCEVEKQAFTPMSLSRTGKSLEICAYSGCASGRLILNRRFGSVAHLQAQVGKARESLSVIYDDKQKVATMWWGGYANAMTCKLEP
jgi:hypothetical protein